MSNLLTQTQFISEVKGKAFRVPYSPDIVGNILDVVKGSALFVGNDFTSTTNKFFIQPNCKDRNEATCLVSETEINEKCFWELEKQSGVSKTDRSVKYVKYFTEDVKERLQADSQLGFNKAIKQPFQASNGYAHVLDHRVLGNS